jgi:hypothetical protein
MRLRSRLLVIATLIVGCAIAFVRFTAPTSSEAQAAHVAAQNATAYTLPPAQLQRAIALGRTRRVLAVTGTAWTLIQLLLILATGAAARMSGFVTRLSKNRWAQGFSFVFLLLLVINLLDLPLGIYGHRAALSYGLSVQGWGSWLGDQAKFFAIEWLFGSLTAMLILQLIRISPTRW